MEIEGEDGSKILINRCSKIDFGRRSVSPNNDDRTISRKHISFELCCGSPAIPNSELNVNFEVLGRNPVWVFDSKSGEIRIFRNSEKGKLGCSDCFCVSAKKPILFVLRRFGDEEEREERGLKEIERKVRESEESRELAERIQSGDDGEGADDRDLGFGSIDVSGMNPSKEFGFVVKGHEFDNYPKHMIRDVKDWDWFLEEKSKDDTEDDELSESDGTRRKKKAKRKSKDEGDAVDEDWTGESDDEKVMLEKLKKGKRPKYATRSKDLKKTSKDLGSSRKRATQKETVQGDGDEEDEETLGGFIVDDEDLEENNVGEDEDEEEEEEEIEDDYDSDEEKINDREDQEE